MKINEKFTKYPSRYIRSSRYIRASISSSAPDWLREFITDPNSSKYVLRKLGVKLDTANFSDYDNGNSLPIYLIETDDEDVLYVPGGNDNDDTYKFNGRHRALGSFGRRALANRTIAVVYLDRDDPNNFDITPDSARYQDPRYQKGFHPYVGSYHQGAYAGQTKLDDGTWTESGDGFRRDKSGYAIPDPEERIHEYYEKFPEKMTDKIDSLYEELIALQQDIFSPERISDPNTSSSYKGAIARLSYAIDAYKKLLRMIDRETGEFQDIDWLGNKYNVNYFTRSVSEVRKNIKWAKEYLNRDDH